jgi:surfactin synthase thioesterase subunit
LLTVLAFGAACTKPPTLDVSALAPLRAEDSRAVTLLTEADRTSNTDARGAARNIREIVLPVLRANARACESVRPEHPEALRLARELCSLLDERVDRVTRYAAALDSDDLEARLREVRAQRAIEDDMGRLEARIRAAAHKP